MADSMLPTLSTNINKVNFPNKLRVKWEKWTYKQLSNSMSPRHVQRIQPKLNREDKLLVRTQNLGEGFSNSR